MIAGAAFHVALAHHALNRPHRPTIRDWKIGSAATWSKRGVEPYGYLLTLEPHLQSPTAHIYIARRCEPLGEPVHISATEDHERFIVLGPTIELFILQLSFCSMEGYIELGYTLTEQTPRFVHPIFRWFTTQVSKL